jgi:hypothetical protein
MFAIGTADMMFGIEFDIELELEFEFELTFELAFELALVLGLGLEFELDVDEGMLDEDMLGDVRRFCMLCMFGFEPELVNPDPGRPDIWGTFGMLDTCGRPGIVIF